MPSLPKRSLRHLANSSAAADTVSGNTTVLFWSSVTRVNNTCPRFVYTDMTHDGLADHFERLFMILALAFEHKDLGVTVVLQHDAFSQKSIHSPHGYADVVEKIFGVPTFLNISYVTSVYQPRMMAIGTNNEVGLYLKRQRDFGKEYPCNSLVKMDVYDMCHGFWCPFFWSGEAKRILQPLLRQSFAANSGCEPYKHAPPLAADNKEPASSLINVVWHLRTGDACLHCTASDILYYSSIHTFIAAALGSKPYRNIIVHQPHPSVHIPTLFASVPNITLFTSDDISHTTCLFFGANILVATGSSFPSLVPWFAPHFFPIMIEEERKWAESQKGKYLYVSTVEEGGFHLKEGLLILNQTVDDLKKALKIQQDLFVNF